MRGILTNFTGEKFGKLSVTNRNIDNNLKVGVARSGMALWDCICDCGNTCEKTSEQLKNAKENNQFLSCESCKIKKIQESQFVKSQEKLNKYGKEVKDYVGIKFNSYTVISRADIKSNDRHTKWVCRCDDCGNDIVRDGRRIDKGTPKCKICFDKNRKKQYFPRLNERISPNEAAFNLVYSSYNQTAKSRQIEFTLSKEEFKKIIKKDCIYCGLPPSNHSKTKFQGNLLYSGIDRIDNTVGYIIDNCVPCCKQCNYMKHTTSIEDFKNRIIKIYNHFINK